MTIRNIIPTLTALFALNFASGQDATLVNDGPEHEERMQWWRDARFGLFIHWGIYSIPGGLWKGESARKDYAEWVMHNFQIPFEEYSQLTKEFNPTRFNPDEWAELAQEAGMGYFVLTTKHHDGFAMFDSKVSEYDIIDATPYDKDIFGQLAEAFRKRGMKVGAYYSQDLDWSQPQGGVIESYNTWDYPVDEADYEIFDAYLHGKSLPQIEELATRYGGVDVFWFDFPRMVDSKRGKLIQDTVRKHLPDAIISGRICNPQGLYADYLVPGDNGYFTSPQLADWECCATMDESWGYKINAHTERSADELIIQLGTTVSSGGNLLLNIGPKPDGTIPQRQIDILKEIGVWMKDNAEAIHGNRANPFGEYFEWGVCTVKDTSLYLHIQNWENQKVIRLPRLNNTVSKIELLGDSGRELPWSQNDAGLTIQLRGKPVHTSASVIKVSTLGNTLSVAPVRLAEVSGEAYLPTRYAQALASRMWRMKHTVLDGNVVANMSQGHPSEKLQWNFTVENPGTYEVIAEFHDPEPDGQRDRTVTILLDGQEELTGRVSVDMLKNELVTLGELDLSRPGAKEISLQVRGGQNKPLYLKALHLKR